MTKRESILAAIETILEAIDGVGVFRSRVAAFQRAEAPAVLLFWTQNTPVGQTVPRITWSLNVRLVLYYRGDQPDKNADSLIEDIHAAMTADLSLGGLAIDVQPSTQSLNLENADDDAAEISLDYTVLYQTAIQDLTGV